MAKSPSIAIYTGVIPNPTFIEHLIEAVAVHYKVYLFGTVKGDIRYHDENITVIPTSLEPWRNIPLTLMRSARLFLKSPKLLTLVIKEARRYATGYEQWMRFSRFVPVLLVQPDIFHLQWAGKLDRWMFLKEAYDCKLVLGLLGSNIAIDPLDRPLLQSVYRRYFPYIDGFQAVSKDMARIAIGYGARPERIVLARTLLKSGIFNHYQVKKERHHPLQLLSVGRHHWVKGYDYAIEALGMLKQEGIVMEYTIVAQGTVSESLRKLVASYGLDAQVHFKGMMPQDTLFSFMQDFDVLLLPSVSEGIANVVLEAMALGVPVISTDCGGMPEVVRPGQTGWLVPPKNSKALSDALKVFEQTNYKDVHAIVERAFQQVSTQFDRVSVINAYLELYRLVLGSE